MLPQACVQLRSLLATSKAPCQNQQPAYLTFRHQMPTLRDQSFTYAVMSGLLISGLWAIASLAVADENKVRDGEALQYFEQHIRPMLVEHCYECHSQAAGKAEGGLRLDSRQAMLTGGDSGPALVAGRPEESLLLEALNYETVEMPPKGKLDAKAIEHFRTWVKAGAVDPRADAVPVSSKVVVDWDQARDHWAFQPLANVTVPPVPREVPSWGRGPIDEFIAAKHRQHQLAPAPEAERATWLRRVSFDLIGLPPTVEELDAFLHDGRPDAYEQVVERLLASPHYGERWGRYWLDLARYADTNGADENHKLPESWRYRDYIVAALNADKPYDRFIHEQLAGDLLPFSSEAERRELLTATGFLVIGPKMLAEQDKDKLVADIVDEQLDTVGKVFLGLTMGCARCHDHKFDPITAADYYALAGVFHSTRTMEHLDHVSQWSERVLPDAEIERQAAAFEQQFNQQQSDFKSKRLVALDKEIANGTGLLRRLWLERIGSPLSAITSSTTPLTTPTTTTTDESPSKAAQTPSGVTKSAELETVDSELTMELTKLLDTAKSLEKWLELSQFSGEPFTLGLQEHWKALKVAQAEQSRAGWTADLLKQTIPATPTELVDAVVSSISGRWRAVGEAYPVDEKLPQKLAADDRELFGKDAWFTVMRLPGKYLTKEARESFAQQAQQMADQEKQRPKIPKAMAVDEAPVKLVAVHVRGNHLQFDGEPLPRRVPTIFNEPQLSELTPPSFPEQASGRLALAQWLTDPAHPLTARVMVNRIWQGHFGEGLVGSSSNFGLRGDEPSHPELLDWLALDFQRHGWSMKHLHRQIVLSSTYRMSWVANAAAENFDPENRLLWRQNRRRLEAEPIRDLLLTVAGRLDHQLGGEFQTPTGQYPDSGLSFGELDSPRRTILLPINRAALNEFFSTFDFLDPAASLEKRPATVVPHQTLFIMNHPMSMHAGWALASRLTEATQSSVDRVRLAYAVVLGRYPNQEESRQALEFVAKHSPESNPDGTKEAWVRFCRSLLLASETIYID